MRRAGNLTRFQSVAVVFAFCLALCPTLATACTITIVGLRKEFRRSDNVFVGEVVSVTGVRPDRLPKNLTEGFEALDKIEFRIKRSWKGKKSGTVEIYSNVFCDCPMRMLKFEKGREFVIFANDGFATACSYRTFDTADERYSESNRADLRRLDSFWFRAWAYIYPF